MQSLTARRLAVVNTLGYRASLITRKSAPTYQPVVPALLLLSVDKCQYSLSTHVENVVSTFQHLNQNFDSLPVRRRLGVWARRLLQKSGNRAAGEFGTAVDKLAQAERWLAMQAGGRYPRASAESFAERDGGDENRSPPSARRTANRRSTLNPLNASAGPRPASASCCCHRITFFNVSDCRSKC